MKRIYALSIISLIIIGMSLTAFSVDDNNAILTNDKLAYMLIGVLGLQMPGGSENLTADEAYEVMANILSNAGVDQFLTSDAANEVTCGEMADIVYVLLKQTDFQDTESRIVYLVNNNFMQACNVDEKLTIGQANAILSNPAFAKVVAEAYSEPIGEERVTDIPGAPEAIEDQPASEI